MQFGLLSQCIIGLGKMGKIILYFLTQFDLLFYFSVKNSLISSTFFKIYKNQLFTDNPVIMKLFSII